MEIWNWATFSSPLRFVQTMFLVVIIMVFELNAFALKTLLWVPPPNLLNVARLGLLGLLALPGVKEYHAWLEVRGGLGVCRSVVQATCSSARRVSGRRRR